MADLFSMFRSAPQTRKEPTFKASAPAGSSRSYLGRHPSMRPIRGARAIEESNTLRAGHKWSTTPLTVDEIIDRNQRQLVAQSRQVAASNDYMKGFIRLCDKNIVGHKGFTLQAQARDSGGALDSAANEALEHWWKNWCKAKNCDVRGRRSFREMCKGAVKAAAKDGEFMFREILGRAAGPAGYALQPLDPQRCPVDYNVDRLANGRFIRQGIEFTREGRATHYYFMRGDMGQSAYTFNGRNLDRVPADEIIHGFVEDIVNQRRGIPWASTALWRLEMLGGFESAALNNARSGASLGGFIEWDKDAGPEIDDELEDEELYIEPEEGVFQELPPGATAKPNTAHYPAGELAPFLKAMLRGAGTGMGVAYVSFANDLEGVNFSSIRQGVLDEREHWMDLQEWLIETLIDRCYQNALRRALLKGQVAFGGIRLRPEMFDKYTAVHWQGRRWAWVDPLKDVNAEVISKNNMLTAPSEIIRRRGEDPDTTWRNFASDIASMKAAGIPDEFIAAAVLGVAPAPAKPKKKEKPDGEDADD